MSSKKCKAWIKLPRRAKQNPPLKFYFQWRIHLARPGGFEPPTSGFVVRYSIQLSYGRKLFSCLPTAKHSVPQVPTKCNPKNEIFDCHLSPGALSIAPCNVTLKISGRNNVGQRLCPGKHIEFVGFL